VADQKIQYGNFLVKWIVMDGFVTCVRSADVSSLSK